MIVSSIDQLIGTTPVVKLEKISQEIGRDIYVKLEYMNPGGSVKDRIAKGMIDDALESGKLKPGDTLIEPTSGNTGIGLVMVAASKGLKSIIVMPDTVSVERQKIVKGYGATLILTPGVEGMNGSIAKATELSEKNGYFMPMQFENKANPKSHETSTALEIIEDFIHLDAFVSTVGTGGTITGTGKILKNHYPDIQLIAVEPETSPVLSGGKPGKHKIMGIGPGFIPKIMDLSIVDSIYKINDDKAFETAKMIAETTGIFGGISTGANIYAAIGIAKTLKEGSQILTIACSNAERYLSTELFK